MQIKSVDLSNPTDTSALLTILNAYAASPTGGDKPLEASTLQQLPTALRECPTYVGLLAWEDDQPVGLLNAFWSVSTFKAQRLLNIHDIAVAQAWQRKGVGRRLLREIETVARELQCCKVTLEVLEGNSGAMSLYQLMGFETYRLNPAMGDAKFMQKWLTGS